MSANVSSFSHDKRRGALNPRILLLALGLFAIGTDAFVIAGVVPVVARETGVTESAAGQMVTIFSLAYGLGAPIMAALTQRIPSNRVLLFSLGAFLLTNVGSALAPTFPLLLLTRLLGGFLVAAYASLAFVVGTQLAPPAMKGRALGLVGIGYTSATVLGAPLGTWIGEHMGWRMTFALVAVLAALALVGLVLAGLPRTTPPPALPFKARFAPIADLRVVLALLPALLWNMAIFLIYTYLSPLLREDLHLSDISALLLVFGLGAVLGNWCGGMLADRLGARRALLMSLVVLIIVEAGMWFALSSLAGCILLLFIWGLCYTILYTSQQHRLLNIASQYANVILGLNSTTLYIGIASGAGLGGVALRLTSMAYFGWLGAGCSLLALVCLLLSLHTQQPASSSMLDQERELQAVVDKVDARRGA